MSANNRAGHKFNVDQVVDYVPKGASKFSVPRGAYKITKLLPERDGELQYRIKNATEDHERVGSESELATLWLPQKRHRCGRSAPPVGIEHGLKRAFGMAMASNNQAYHVLGACPIR